MMSGSPSCSRSASYVRTVPKTLERVDDIYRSIARLALLHLLFPLSNVSSRPSLLLRLPGSTLHLQHKIVFPPTQFLHHLVPFCWGHVPQIVKHVLISPIRDMKFEGVDFQDCITRREVGVKFFDDGTRAVVHAPPEGREGAVCAQGVFLGDGGSAAGAVAVGEFEEMDWGVGGRG